MTPRVATKPPSSGWGPLRFATIAFALLAGTISARDVSAAPTSITTRPAAPTVCDSVGLIVAGSMPNVCYHLIGAEIEGPTELPTMGPIPTYAIRVRLTVQEPDPLPAIYCLPILAKYEHGFRLGLLPAGRYLVSTVEYLVPFSRDSTAAPKDSSKLDSAFNVNSVAPCPPGEGCALLSFGPSDLVPRVGQCNATTRPGGTACFDVTLMTAIPVGGVQTEIAVFAPGSNTPVPPELLHPISVEVASGAAGFQVAWTAEGSRAKILLFTTGSATIPPGEGPILHVCYAVGASTPGGRYVMRYQNTIVADPSGEAIRPCLTFAEITGSICVVKVGCDLNGDGVSDILDIVELVHCALSGPGGSSSCPDSLAAKADCNGDGLVNIRDVICCVRKILSGGGFGSNAPPDTTGATQIGFTGPAQWTSPVDGKATIEILPGTGFAGIQFGIDGTASRARIREFRLVNPTGEFQLEADVDGNGGMARAMLFPSVPGLSARGPIRVEVILEPAIGDVGDGPIELYTATSANLDAKAIATQRTAPLAEVPEAPGVGAPSLSIPSPNPFAVGTEIGYTLPSPRRVTLRVYSVSGRLVRTLVDATIPGGVHRVQWDGRDSAGREARSGIYFFKFTAGEVERTARVMRLR